MEAARYLLIVARDQPDLCDYLMRDFAGDEEVQVDEDLRSRSFVIIHRQPRAF